MWHTYMNGNVKVTINDENGTKIRETEEDEFRPQFPENCDVTITYKCDGNCKYCYLGCTEEGQHGDLLNRAFLDSLHPYTELAIAGNSLDHPQLMWFLLELKKRNIITNVTVNQKHFMKNIDLLRDLYSEKLIYGIGVSLISPSEDFIRELKGFPTATLHVINGIFSERDYFRLRNRGLKLLILGYKDLGRGKDYLTVSSREIRRNQDFLRDNLNRVVTEFSTVSFDNLSIEQLNVKSLMTDSEWEEFYQGDEGSFTFYIDLVNKTFARDSLIDEKFNITSWNVDDMFRTIKEVYG